ncbi:hypothetical protein DFQ27_003040 [Actinomortierella ambigua]|uniref:L-type lectin-like domain-containing protein n=1 Tax=Actinomortierella ambigua TaxID=1343610 RepID=A0A9P6QMX6_9FUNG|nr:hypothetical protein DFQ27_003040 [Actinomortierella ambigua]
MKFSLLLAPALVLSTVAAWGRDPPSARGNSATEPQPAVSRRYDYKQSLKKPFMYNGAIPFWGYHGNTFVALDFIRLSPSVPRLRGSVWRSTANEHKEWEVEFSFKAFGQSPIGGKGLAFWYTSERAIEGPVFGSKDKWKGLGIFMDTSDPANQRSNSVIYSIVNDGTREFPTNPIAGRFSGCLRDYKNSPIPVVVKVSYYGKTLKVAVDTITRGRNFVTCFEEKDIDLPVGYYFGFSAEAAEIGNPDDHDLYTFEVYEVNPPAKSKSPPRPHEEEMLRKGEEAKIDAADKDTFESVQKIVEEQERKLREETEGVPLTPAQIAAAVGDSQYRIIESLNTIHQKLETLGAPTQPPETTSSSIAEINQKLEKMTASLHAMENVVQGMVDHILKNKGTGDISEVSKVLKEELKTLNAKMEDMDSRQSFQHRITQTKLLSASSTSWVTYVVFLILVQVVAVSAYTWYKKRLEMNEKKFI